MIEQRKITVTLGNEKILISGKQSLLDNLESRGIKKKGCRKGVCGRCRVKILNGEVRTVVTSGLFEMERQDGWVLLCQSEITNDIEISIT